MWYSLGIPINPRPKPAGYVPGAVVRARVAARCERVETFMALCKPCARHPGFVRLGPLSEPVLSRAAREKAAKVAKRKAMVDTYAQRRREEAAANVAELIQLRLAGEQRKKKDGEHEVDFADILSLEAQEKERLMANRPTTCETCKIKTNALYRCRNCFWPRIICCKCLLAAHAEHPLHCVEDVPASHGYTLSAMGLVVFLGHGGAKCPEVVIDADFTVLGVDGAHDVTMGFCGCDGGLTHGQQLEAMRLHGWRSSHTALTFEMHCFYTHSGRFTVLRERLAVARERLGAVWEVVRWWHRKTIQSTLLLLGWSSGKTATRIALASDVVGIDDVFQDVFAGQKGLSALNIARPGCLSSCSHYARGGESLHIWDVLGGGFKHGDGCRCDSTMPCPRGDERELVADSDSEDVAGSAPEVDLVPEQHIHRGQDSRLHHNHSMVEAPASPSKSARKPVASLKADSEVMPMDDFDGGLPDVLAQDNDVVYDLLPKEPREQQPSDRPLAEWVRKCKPQKYLDQLIQLEGRSDYQEDNLCIVCGVVPDRLFRCRDCFTDDIFCRTCLVHAHGSTPLHIVEAWTGEFFERTTLKALGLRIQLGHGKLNKVRPQHGICTNPRPAVADDFVVLDTNAIHEVTLDFCGCKTAQLHNIQLLLVLQEFSVVAKIKAVSKVGSRRTSMNRHQEGCDRRRPAGCCRGVPQGSHSPQLPSNHPVRCLLCSVKIPEAFGSAIGCTGQSLTKLDRYDEFLRMTREWRHLQMLKRAGHGHDSSGVEGTGPGECALLCPACPHPGKNLPPDWKEVPPEKKFLYALFLAMDANFRMRRKKVSTEEKDPSLGDGWSFYGAIAPYYSYLAANWKHKQERSTCVAHDAVDKPDRESRGTASSGIATVDCARHNMKRLNAVGDLQLGERQSISLQRG
ncbi:hypothetical protein B0H16DRAFT_1462814 [Mycena metata]|uniref:CxC2-like cysteine cluster KDZ transposase-associated domain-containing protein n=1 Tax=Mycena metata TaxID=1033252 RepID=A0AAD7IKH5_9AGAR|nr:hypothetical protein B0H16DRAFT_1462814 [Mycena metata]